jgi:hypothetical protein
MIQLTGGIFLTADALAPGADPFVIAGVSSCARRRRRSPATCTSAAASPWADGAAMARFRSMTWTRPSRRLFWHVYTHIARIADVIAREPALARRVAGET